MTDFSDQFRKIIIRYKRIGYNLNVMRQFSLNIFNCLFNNGVGLQVLTTLVTARPLQHLYTTANMAYIKHLRYNKHVYIRSR